MCILFSEYILAVFASDCTIKNHAKTNEAWRKMAEYIEQKNSPI